MKAQLAGAPRFAEVIEFMAQRGFAAYDIVGGFNSPTDGALVLVDVVFVREEPAQMTSPRSSSSDVERFTRSSAGGASSAIQAQSSAIPSAKADSRLVAQRLARQGDVGVAVADVAVAEVVDDLGLDVELQLALARASRHVEHGGRRPVPTLRASPSAPRWSQGQLDALDDVGDVDEVA